MRRSMLGFAVVIGCGLLMMPLLVDVDQRHALKAAPSPHQLAVAEVAPR